MLDRSGSDQRIAKANTSHPADPAAALDDGCIERKLFSAGQQ